MRHLLHSAVMLAALTGAANADGTPPDAGLDGTVWALLRLDGVAIVGPTTLQIDGDRLSGQGPCNRYFGDVTLAPPVFRAAEIGATRMACPDLALESQYFTALGAVDQLALTADGLVLTGAGHELVFSRRPE